MYPTTTRPIYVCVCYQKFLLLDYTLAQCKQIRFQKVFLNLNPYKLHLTTKQTAFSH